MRSLTEVTGLVFFALLFGAVFVAVYSGTTSSVDQSVFRLFNDAALNPNVAALALLVTEFGSEFLLAGVGLAYYLAGDSDRSEVLLGVLVAVVASDIILFFLKAAYYRPRPYVILANVNLPGGIDFDSSFPSGHATRAFSVSTLLAIKPGKRLRALFALAFAVAISRIILGVHFPTDVLAGALLGTTVGLATIALTSDFLYPWLLASFRHRLKSSGN